MEAQVFDVLENKIDQALSLIAQLKEENANLKQKVQELNLIIQQKDEEILTLEQESNRAKNMKVELDTYHEKQDRIRNKVETLLDKLKEFEEIQ